jgi:hypothetical protein
VWRKGVREISKHNECGSKENSLSESRNKKIIRSKALLLALFSEKLRRLKYGLCSQDPCPRYAAFQPESK